MPSQQNDLEAVIEAIHAALMQQFPDPVDVFEDELAQTLGLTRDPALSLDEWRFQSALFIDAAD